MTLAVALDGWRLLRIAANGNTALIQADCVAQFVAALLLAGCWVLAHRHGGVSQRMAFVIGAICGMMFFTRIYGFSLLDPTRLDWVLRGDWAATYSGWAMFRHEPWRWPLGALPNLMYPVGTSIVYSDALPLLALVFKPFSNTLPESFQYLGIWFAICSMLQGAFGALLIHRRTRSAAAVLVGAMLFLYAPIFIERSGHVTLMGQWLLLAGLWLYFRPASDRSLAAEAWPWWLLSGISALVMPYLAMMLLGINVAYWYRRVYVDAARSWREAAQVGAATAVLMLSLWWLSGAFIVHYRDGAGGISYGTYSFNLLGFFNAGGFSRIVPPLPTAGPGQGEGFAYLGLGIFGLLGLLAMQAIFRRARPQWPRRHWPLGIVALGMTAFAASTVLTIGAWKLTDFPLQTPLLATFRSSGRFIWVPYYLILLWTIWSTLKRWPKAATTLLVASLAMQSWELSWAHTYFAQLRTGTGWPPAEHPLADAQWDSLADGHHHLTLVPPAACGVQPASYLPFVLLASKHAMTLNTAYVARWDPNANLHYCEQLTSKLANRELDPDDLYVVADDWQERFMQAAPSADCRTLDGLRACVLRSGATSRE